MQPLWKIGRKELKEVCSFMFNINNQTYLMGMFLALCAFPLQGAALCQISISIFLKDPSSVAVVYSAVILSTELVLSVI